MKKTVKTIVVVLLIGVAIAASCFIFFKNRNKILGREVNLLNFLTSEVRVNYEQKVEQVTQLINKDSTDNRFQMLQTTIDNLDDSYDALLPYYLDSNFITVNENISKTIKSIKATATEGMNILAEYEIKVTHIAPNGNQYFDRHIGANDLYNNVSKYVVEHAHLLKLMNEDIKDVNKFSDVKFNIVEVYSNVAINTFANLDFNNNSWRIPKSTISIEWLNSGLNKQNMYLITNVHSEKMFSGDINNFCRYYDLCDKLTFVQDFEENISIVTKLEEGLTNEKLAIFYLKGVMS